MFWWLKQWCFGDAIFHIAHDEWMVATFTHGTWLIGIVFSHFVFMYEGFGNKPFGGGLGVVACNANGSTITWFGLVQFHHPHWCMCACGGGHGMVATQMDHVGTWYGWCQHGWYHGNMNGTWMDGEYLVNVGWLVITQMAHGDCAMCQCVYSIGGDGSINVNFGGCGTQFPVVHHIHVFHQFEFWIITKHGCQLLCHLLIHVNPIFVMGFCGPIGPCGDDVGCQFIWQSQCHQFTQCWFCHCATIHSCMVMGLDLMVTMPPSHHQL